MPARYHCTAPAGCQPLLTPIGRYSTYEAKARFSEVLRLVREGTTVTVTYRGDPVAEIRPIEAQAASIDEHFAALEKRGIVVPAEDPRSPLARGEPNPGGLARFLADRNK